MNCVPLSNRLWPQVATETTLFALMAVLLLLMPGCGDGSGSGLAQLTRARHLSAESLIEFTRRTDAVNRAVMADTDAASNAFADEARTSARTLATNLGELAPLIGRLRFEPEAVLIETLERQLAAFEKVEQETLDLAVQNTNLKAQRLFFGEAFAAADQVASRLADVCARCDASQRSTEIRAAALAAVAATREIQALLAPHIAEADAAAMTRLEERATAADTTARQALERLEQLMPSRTSPPVDESRQAFERFAAANREIVALSRRNSNVRSLALALGETRSLALECDKTLRALQAALAARTIGGTR